MDSLDRDAQETCPPTRLDALRPAPLAPPPPPEHQTAWTDEARNDAGAPSCCALTARHQIGYDMDYTLAQYIPETFEALVYAQALGVLVSRLGYPEEVRCFQFDAGYMVRGLAVDKARGNVLKMDRHKYVKLAFHGFQELGREERLATYADAPGRESYDEPEYALLDTLFSLGETYLFCQLVEFKDNNPSAGLPPYARLHADVRLAVDMCHRDGSLKRVVAEDPGRYIYRDPSLVPLLDMQLASGRKLFLLTNSLWDYTHVVMNFLCDGLVGPAKSLAWTQRFACIVTGAAKPSFFENERAAIYAVEPASGHLLNTDNGAPLPHVGGSDPQAATPQLHAPEVLDGGAPAAPAPAPRVFQGGCYRHLHAMLGVNSGAQVLYIGDHIYGDILRSKKTLGWRTALVVPELAAELRVRAKTPGAAADFGSMRARRSAIEDELQRLSWAREHRRRRAAAAAAAPDGGGAGPPPAVDGPPGSWHAAAAAAAAAGGGDGGGLAGGEEAVLEQRIKALAAERDVLRKVHRDRLRDYHRGFHPVWGQLMKTGYANSRFASQVERFACLYTSHVGNLLAYSPDRNFRKAEDWLAHERQETPPQPDRGDGAHC